MHYRTFPGTTITVSEIGFGLWTIGDDWWGHIPDDEGRAMIRHALDLGINFFDTSNTYGQGRAERLMGEALRGVPRKEYVIAAKFGYDIHTEHARSGQRERPHRWEPAFIRQSLDESLQRMGTDYVEHYLLHNPRMDAIRNDEIWETLETLKAEGKILGYGVAMGPRIGWLDESIAAMRTRDIQNCQMIFNLLEQEPGRTLIPVAEAEGVGLMVRVPTSSGMLEGIYDETTVFPPSDHRSHRERKWLVEGLQKAQKVAFLQDRCGDTPTQSAYRYVLSFPAVMSVTPNFTSREGMTGAAAMSDGRRFAADELVWLSDQYDENFGIAESDDMQKLVATAIH